MKRTSMDLPMERARLVISVVNPIWWEWRLVHDSGEAVLGADSPEHSAGRVLVRLRGGLEPAGEIEGRTVGWVLSLSEKHHSIYLAEVGSDRLIYFQNAEGELIWRDRLTKENLARWSAILGPATEAG